MIADTPPPHQESCLRKGIYYNYSKPFLILAEIFLTLKPHLDWVLEKRENWMFHPLATLEVDLHSSSMPSDKIGWVVMDSTYCETTYIVQISLWYPSY